MEESFLREVLETNGKFLRYWPTPAGHMAPASHIAPKLQNFSTQLSKFPLADHYQAIPLLQTFTVFQRHISKPRLCFHIFLSLARSNHHKKKITTQSLGIMVTQSRGAITKTSSCKPIKTNPPGVDPGRSTIETG